MNKKYFSLKGIIKNIFLAIIQIYRFFISPLKQFLLPATGCRYSPSCSLYAFESFQRFGLFKGGMLTIKRLLRCQPWGGYGYDPIPEKEEK